MDVVLAAAVPQLRDAADGQVTTSPMTDSVMGSNLKTALVLVSIAVAFFIGVMIRHWVW